MSLIETIRAVRPADDADEKVKKCYDVLEKEAVYYAYLIGEPWAKPEAQTKEELLPEVEKETEYNDNQADDVLSSKDETLSENEDDPYANWDTGFEDNHQEEKSNRSIAKTTELTNHTAEDTLSADTDNDSVQDDNAWTFTTDDKPAKVTMDNKENAPLTEETVKNLDTFQFLEKTVIASTKAGDVQDEIRLLIYPLQTEDSFNVPILVIAKLDNTMYCRSSYDNKPASNMVRMNIKGHELLFRGEISNSRFSCQIQMSGASVKMQEKLINVSESVHNPEESKKGLGHIFLHYADQDNTQGTLQIFPAFDDYLCINQIAEFTDYYILSKRDFVSRTADGSIKQLSLTRQGNTLKAELVPFKF